MRKKVKILLIALFGIIGMCFIGVDTFAAEYEDIPNEVATLVENGTFQSYHLALSYNTGYQTLYTKMYRQGGSSTKEAFAKMTSSELRCYISMYENDWNDVWYDIVTNLDIEPAYLDPNRILGLYFDGDAGSTYSYLYLVWTSKYIPSEFMTINELTVNGKTYSQYPTNDFTKPLWYDSKYYYYEQYDLALHLTPIAGFEDGKEFGIPIKQKYSFTNIKIGIDKLQFDNNPDPTNKYSSSIDTDAAFDLGITPTYHGKSACQLVTHAYKLIKDCEVQSYYDMGFGGYMHFVHFNTSIPIDKIYRVDVSYVLTSDNKDWYQFWLNEDETPVKKSMRPEKKSTGIFGLYDTYGFKEGVFKSNEKNSITYKYEMQLNYSEQNWDWFGDTCVESNYKRIKNFKILRLNYLVDNKVYDVKVTMDAVDGDTLNIIDRELILDTDSTLWKVKDKAYDAVDGIANAFNIAKNVVAVVAAVTVFLIIFYGGYQLVLAFKEVFKNDPKE